MSIAAYSKEIVSSALTLVVWALNYFTKARTKIEYAVPHDFMFLVNEPLLGPDQAVIQQKRNVHTITQTVTNAGTQTATNVELVFNFKPKYFNVWPRRHFTEHDEVDNRYTIIFDSMAPRESVQFHTFTIDAESPKLISVRGDQCVGKLVHMQTFPAPPRWKVRLIIMLALIGFAATIYVALVVLQFVITSGLFVR